VAPARVFDGTIAAQKALSAVFRTGQRFGAKHVVQVLLGESSEAILRWAHDRLPTFGVGKDQPGRFWHGVIRQLVALGALDVAEAEEGFRTLRLDTDRARPILRGEERVLLREDAAEAPRAERSRRRGTAAADATPPSAEAGGLFEALRQWRATEAKAQSVPPYVIFHDSVLREIAAVRPRDLDDLGGIKGVGTSKLTRYGADVLAVLRRSAD